MTTRDNSQSAVYTVTEAIDAGFFPWISNMSRRKQYTTITRAIKADYMGKNILKAAIEGSGTNTRYRLRGENIRKFVEVYGPGLALHANNAKIWKKATQSKS